MWNFLSVLVPPVFIDDGSTTSATVIIRENENLTLSCRAQGFPQPKIVWKREDGRDIVLSKKMKGKVILYCNAFSLICEFSYLLSIFRQDRFSVANLSTLKKSVEMICRVIYASLPMEFHRH